MRRRPLAVRVRLVSVRDRRSGGRSICLGMHREQERARVSSWVSDLEKQTLLCGHLAHRLVQRFPWSPMSGLLTVSVERHVGRVHSQVEMPWLSEPRDGASASVFVVDQSRRGRWMRLTESHDCIREGRGCAQGRALSCESARGRHNQRRMQVVASGCESESQLYSLLITIYSCLTLAGARLAIHSARPLLSPCTTRPTHEVSPDSPHGSSILAGCCSLLAWSGRPCTAAGSRYTLSPPPPPPPLLLAFPFPSPLLVSPEP